MLASARGARRRRPASSSSGRGRCPRCWRSPASTTCSCCRRCPARACRACCWRRWHPGLPIVVSDVAGVPTLVQHEVNGLLVPPADPAAIADAVDRLIRDGDLRRRLIATGNRAALGPHGRLPRPEDRARPGQAGRHPPACRRVRACSASPSHAGKGQRGAPRPQRGARPAARPGGDPPGRVQPVRRRQVAGRRWRTRWPSEATPSAFLVPDFAATPPRRSGRASACAS